MEMQRQQRDRECLRDASRLLYGSLTGKGSAGYREAATGSPEKMRKNFRR